MSATRERPPKARLQYAPTTGGWVWVRKDMIFQALGPKRHDFPGAGSEKTGFSRGWVRKDRVFQGLGPKRHDFPGAGSEKT